MSEKSLPIVPTEEWNKLYWAYNVPLWGGEKDEEGIRQWRVVNYMPRKEKCSSLDETVSEAELPQFCANAALILRNLATLFDLLGKGEIDYIYYPTILPAEAIEDFKKEQEEKVEE
jgi:hypothetical protein